MAKRGKRRGGSRPLIGAVVLSEKELLEIVAEFARNGSGGVLKLFKVFTVDPRTGEKTVRVAVWPTGRPSG